MHQIKRPNAKPSESAHPPEYVISHLLHKDAILNEVSKSSNVAQFVSFSPLPEFKQRFSRIRGFKPNHQFSSIEQAVQTLLESSPEGSVNIRSFDPERPKEGEFIYGLKNDQDVMAKLHELAIKGFFTIVNETVDVRDGGVSGVAFGGIIEFAPDDTPRCVEKLGVLSVPFEFGIRLLEKVYQFKPSIDYLKDARIEFSIHPIRRGFRNEHTIVWEVECLESIMLTSKVEWSNKFSRIIGDKAFGLLVADLLGLPIPLTTVISRRLPLFRFGRPTETGETWIRTCPLEPAPGRFATKHGWCDPFNLMSKEDPEGNNLASIIVQDAVEPIYSGGGEISSEGAKIIEGVRGSGDKFMVARVSPEDKLPSSVERAVQKIFDQAIEALGPVKIEWVFDGNIAWVLQIHRGATTAKGLTIFPGETTSYVEFEASRGIEALRNLIAKLEGTGQGIILLGNVGITSHFGDLLRRAKIPSKIVPIGNILTQAQRKE